MKLLINLIFIYMISTSPFSFAQWQEMNGPYGGEIKSLAYTPDYIFASTLGDGVLRSADQGLSWSRCAGWVSYKNIGSLCVSSKPGGGYYVFAGTSGYGIYVSTDYGSNWSSVTTLGFNPYEVYSLASSADRVFAGTWDGMYTATINGEKWTKVPGVNSTVNAIFFNFPYIYAGSNNGVYRSTDNGGSWGYSGLDKVESFAKVQTTSGNLIFAATESGIFRSADNGTNWEAVNIGLTNLYIKSLTVCGKNIFAGTRGSGIYLSTNNGLIWRASNNGLTSPVILSLISKDSIVFAGTLLGGVFRSTNQGESWDKESNGLQAWKINTLFKWGEKVLAGTDGSGAYISADNALSWEPLNIDLNSNFTLGFSKLPEVNGLAAGTWFGGAFASLDNGYNWHSINDGLPEGVYCFAVQDPYFFAGTNSGVYISTNQGTTWTAVNNGITWGWIRSFIFSGNVIIAGTEHGEIFRSTDYGANWTNVYYQFGNYLISSFASSGGNVYAATHWGIIFSSDHGTTWNYLNNGLNNRVLKSICIIGNHMFAGGNGGVYHSINGGAFWTKVNEGFYSDSAYVFCLATTNSFLLAGTSAGVWRRPLSDWNITSNVEPTPVYKYFLSQNYPNPFNPSTTINYSLPEYRRVLIKVFDILGNEIATLFDEEKPAGQYEVNWNAADLPSGVYFYQLRAGAFVETKKMILMR